MITAAAGNLNSESWLCIRAGISSVGSHGYNKDAYHLKSRIITTWVLYKRHKYLVFSES